MKKIGACFWLAGVVSAASAQTNVPVQTNAPAQAGASAVRILSLQECIQEALQHNFDVRVERYNPLIARFGLDAAYAGYDPALNLSGNHSHSDTGGWGTNGISVSDSDYFDSNLGGTLSSGTQYKLDGNVTKYYNQGSEDASGGSVGATLTQPLLKNFWTDQTRLTISSAKNTVKTKDQELRNQLITTVSAVENAYYELIYAREDLSVKQEALALASTQLDEDRQRVKAGSVAERAGTLEQDEKQVAQSRADLIAAQYTLASDENALKMLITDDYLQWHDVDIQPAGSLDAVRQWFDVQASWNQGLTSRPDLIQAKIKLEQQGIQLKYDRNQLFPELDLKGSYGFNGGGQGFDDALSQYATANRPTWSYGAQVTMPLGNVAARSSYKSDQAVEKQEVLQLKQLEQSIMVAIDNAVKLAQSDWESVEASRSARIYAEASLAAEQKKYAVGKSTTFTVLTLQNDLTAARSAEIRAQANYKEALTALAQAEGSTLERRNVNLSDKP